VVDAVDSVESAIPVLADAGVAESVRLPDEPSSDAVPAVEPAPVVAPVAPAAAVPAPKPVKTTAYYNRYGKPFTGPIIAFGAAVEYKPSSDRGRAQLPKFGDKLLKGIFVGYKTHSGGLWSGDLAIVDVADLAKANLASEVPVCYFKAAEILPVK
jgi:hypothetical protein